MLKVLLAGGGTAGHVNPALAIAEIIRKHHPDAEICFAGNPNKLEAKLVPDSGYAFEPIMVEGFQRKINGENIKRNLKALWYLSRTGSRAKEIIKKFQPDLVIGTGGYVAGPIVRKAAQMGIKTAIHEQNAFPGVTNKLLSKHCDKVMLTVEKARGYFPDAKDITVTGLPVRKAFSKKTKSDARHELGFADNEICILSTGGSLGARVLNEQVAKLLKWYQDNDIKVNHIHSYGTYQGYSNYIQTLEEQGIDVAGNKRLYVKDYINMPTCMAAADLIITRCGASIIAEIEAMGRGAILIPSPMVAENHQYHNGMVLQEAGAGYVFEEKDLKDDTIINKVRGLLDNLQELNKLSENSAKLFITDTDERIYNTLKPLINGN